MLFKNFIFLLLLSSISISKAEVIILECKNIAYVGKDTSLDNSASIEIDILNKTILIDDYAERQQWIEFNKFKLKYLQESAEKKDESIFQQTPYKATSYLITDISQNEIKARAAPFWHRGNVVINRNTLLAQKNNFNEQGIEEIAFKCKKVDKGF